MGKHNTVNAIDFLPLYEWAYPLYRGKNVYHASSRGMEQVVVCDLSEKEKIIIYENSHTSILLEDRVFGNLFSIHVDGSFCNIEKILPHETKESNEGNERIQIPLQAPEESIVEATANLGYMFLRLTSDISSDISEEQTSRIFLVDFKKKSFIQIKADAIVNSYRLPYIVEHKSSSLAIIEDSAVFPYENYELSRGGINTIVSRILSTRIDDLFSGDLLQSADFDEIMTSEGGSEKYVQILDVQRDSMLVTQGDIKNQSFSILCVDYDGQIKGSTVQISDRPLYSVGDLSGNIFIVSHRDEKTILYNDKGLIIATVDHNKFKPDNPNVECSAVVGVVDGECIVFDAIDYSDEDSIQVRVVYDIQTELFTIIKSSLLDVNGRLC